MSEANLHIKVAQYIRSTYPDIIFTSESSGVRLTIGQAVLLKKLRSDKAMPDLWLLEARKGFHGMLLELKKEGTIIYKKDGELRRDKHLKEQEEILKRLTDKGYFAKFCVGFDAAKSLIDFYLREANE